MIGFVQNDGWKLTLCQLLSRPNGEQWARKPGAHQSQRWKKTNGPQDFTLKVCELTSKQHEWSWGTVTGEGNFWVMSVPEGDTFSDQGATRQYPWDRGHQSGRSSFSIHEILVHLSARQTWYEWRSKSSLVQITQGLWKLGPRACLWISCLETF